MAALIALAGGILLSKTRYHKRYLEEMRRINEITGLKARLIEEDDKSLVLVTDDADNHVLLFRYGTEDIDHFRGFAKPTLKNEPQQVLVPSSDNIAQVGLDESITFKPLQGRWASLKYWFKPEMDLYGDSFLRNVQESFTSPLSFITQLMEYRGGQLWENILNAEGRGPAARQGLGEGRAMQRELEGLGEGEAEGMGTSSRKRRRTGD